MITLEKGEYVLGVWICGGPASDVLTIIKRQPGQRWQVHTRVRYYVDDLLWEESKDKKTFYTWTMLAEFTEEEMTETGREVAQLGKELGLGKTINEVLVKSTDPKVFAECLARIPDFHFKTETIQ
jgi:hypothetical protein